MQTTPLQSKAISNMEYLAQCLKNWDANTNADREQILTNLDNLIDELSQVSDELFKLIDWNDPNLS